jgi:hypothetical protein
MGAKAMKPERPPSIWVVYALGAVFVAAWAFVVLSCFGFFD